MPKHLKKMPLNLGLVRFKGNDQNGPLFGIRGGQKGGPHWVNKASVQEIALWKPSF